MMGGGSGDRRLPAGDVCFLFTDVEGSTDILRSVGDARWADIRDRAHALIATAVQGAGGVVVGIEGDGCFAAFPVAASAAEACMRAQAALRTAAWGDDVPLRVRMGLHAGTGVTPRDGDYVALAVHRAARVCSSARGGQVLATAAVAAGVPGRFVDLGLYSVRDFDGPVRLYSLASDTDSVPGENPLPRVPPAFDPQVPRYDTALVGRDDEIHQALAHLDRSPVVTLTGGAGVGKTRLAVAVLSERSQQAGAWFVDLTAVSDPSYLGDAVARAVGCPPDVEVDAHLDAVLAGRRGVLVLDHCDELPAQAGAVAELLRDWNPTLRVLCTCRDPLGLAREAVLEIAPLEQPPSAEPAAVLASGAGRLFLERAQRSGAAAELPHALAPDVVRICRATNGNALALEVSAGLCADEPVPTIASVLERAMSIPDLLDLALDRIDGDAQRLLAVLSTLAHRVPHVLAVVAADAAGVVDPERSLDLLVRHALLTRTDTGGYGLLPAVRARAALRLGENLRVTVLLDILRACLAATAVPPLPVTEHDSVGPVAAALVHEPVLTAADRQRLAAQLGPWWSGRLGGRRARDLLGEALALGRHGAATAALHLAIARTYGPGTETVETEHHLHEAARLLGEVDPVPASLVERLRQTVAGHTESEPGAQADGTLPADRTGEP